MNGSISHNVHVVLLLMLPCRLLEAPSSTPVAMPLRMLEVYTDVTTYTQNGIALDDAIKTVAALQMYLVQNGNVM